MPQLLQTFLLALLAGLALLLGAVGVYGRRCCGKPESGRKLQSPVDLTPVPNVVHGNRFDLRRHLIDHAIITDADTVEPFGIGQLEGL